MKLVSIIFLPPYDFGATEMLDAFVPAFKIGSGEITWLEALEAMAKKGKPMLLATGASTLGKSSRQLTLSWLSTLIWC